MHYFEVYFFSLNGFVDDLSRLSFKAATFKDHT